MTYQVVAGIEAAREWHAAVKWYEEQEPGVGLRFDEELRGFLLALAHEPERFRLVTRLCRKARLPKPWPYSVYFTVNRKLKKVEILALWHAARNPADLKRRLR
jgi:plasmid stabilization system protein ParE